MISYLLKLIKDSFEHDFITWQSLSSLKNFWILPARWQLETSERSQLLDFLRHFLLTRTIYGQCKMCMSMILIMFSSIFVDLHEIREGMLGGTFFNVHHLPWSPRSPGSPGSPLSTRTSLSGTWYPRDRTSFLSGLKLWRRRLDFQDENKRVQKTWDQKEKMTINRFNKIKQG